VPQTPAFDETLDQDLSSWDAIAEEAWPGGPMAGRASDPPPRGQASGNGIHGQAYDPWGEPREEDPASSPRPIYVWNPAASTDHIPIIPPGENHQK